jgi:hypothetical protein
VRRARLLIPAFASALGFLDTGATLVALPTIADDLAISIGQTTAVLSVALLLIGLLVVPAGVLVDRWGAATVGRCGLVLAAAASTVTALSSDAFWLLGSRAAFGLAAGLFLPAALAQAGDPRSGPRGLIRWTVTVSVVTLLAPLVGASAVAAGSWRTLYLAEVAIAVVLAIGWRAGPPVVPVEVVRRRVRMAAIIGVQALTVCAYAAFAGLPFLLSEHLQRSLGYHPIAVGLLLSIDGLLVVVLTGRLGRTDRGAADRLVRVAAGGACCALAVVPLLFVQPGLAGAVLVTAGLLALGVGSALFIAPLTALAVGVLGPARQGQAAGISLAVARFSAAAGVAAVGALSVATRAGQPDAAVTAYRQGLLLVGTLFVAAGAVTVLLLRAGHAAADPEGEDQQDRGDQEGADDAAGTVRTG